MDTGITPVSNMKSAQSLKKCSWTEDEDRQLIRLVEQLGSENWSQIGKNFSGRCGKQCRDRWSGHLRPGIKKDRWTTEEELILVKAHSKLGCKWVDISKLLPGRTDGCIKNYWNCAKRRKVIKGKPSVLEEYIKNLENYSSSSTAYAISSPPETTNNITIPGAVSAIMLPAFITSAANLTHEPDCQLGEGSSSNPFPIPCSSGQPFHIPVLSSIFSIGKISSD